MQAKPAMVQPPQHQHTTQITISGVGESEDAEFREPTPSQASSASPKSTDTRPVGGKAVSTNGGAKKTLPFTDGTEFLAVGVSKKRGKFLLVAKDDKHVVLSVRNLARDPNAELERLEGSMFTSWCPTPARLSFAAPKRLRGRSQRSRSPRRSGGSTMFSSSRIGFIRLSLP